MKARLAKKLLRQLTTAQKLIIPDGHFLIVTVTSDHFDIESAQLLRKNLEKYVPKAVVLGHDRETKISFTVAEQAPPAIPSVCHPPSALAEPPR